MDYRTLVEALKLGSDTGKSRKDNLGSYGTGMKAAALSMSRRVVIRTKSEHDDFYIAEFDLDAILSSGVFEVPVYQGSDKEYAAFSKEIGSTHGTSLCMYNLDKIDNKDIRQFSSKLMRDFGMFYKIFIENNRVNISINGKLVKPLDPMHRNPVGEKSVLLSVPNEEFSYNDNDFVFNAFYIHKTDNNSSKKEGVVRNSSNAGLYIYRNNRLVGSGLDLGIIGKQGDGYLNGLRIELFVNGECDDLFGSTFMKMIHEKNKGELNQDFLSACKKHLSKYVTATKNLDKIGSKNNDVDVNVEEEFKKNC